MNRQNVRRVWYMVIVIIFFSFSCEKEQVIDPKEFQIVKDAYNTGHLTVVQAILSDRKKERKLSLEEENLYLKSLFYLSEWNEFLKEWNDTQKKTPELIMYYFKVILLSKEKIQVNLEEEKQLLELLVVSPEACLLYLQWNEKQIKTKHKSLFLAQSKQFQNYLNRMNQELSKK
ncbi:hypothetical protein [Leptospira levettii]|uniref:Uncharacterized protein n=1 Tax=Leptospira levettii TaxID=2023178 RepID=A0ABY2MTX5_9LEPT|nr:hypothetical protein [Leptospira levettii]TGL74936.1 hypothetical protein EHQ60_01090 [Leptospira levettii]